MFLNWENLAISHEAKFSPQSLSIQWLVLKLRGLLDRPMGVHYRKLRENTDLVRSAAHPTMEMFTTGKLHQYAMQELLSTSTQPPDIIFPFFDLECKRTIF